MIKTYDDELDTSGLLCPMPLAKAKRKLKLLAAGKVLRVTSTDPSSVLDFKVFAEVSGNELIEIQQDRGVFVFYIKKAKPC